MLTWRGYAQTTPPLGFRVRSESVFRTVQAAKKIVQAGDALDEELMENYETVKRRWRNHKNHRGRAGWKGGYE